METTISLTSARIGIPYANRPTSRCFQPKHKRFAVVSVSTPSTSTNGLKIEATTSYTAATTTTTTSTVYKDNWLEQVVINYLSKAVQDTIGIRNEKSGYESLVVAAGSVFRSFDLIQQRQLVVKALQSAVPGPVSFMIKKLMPPSKFSREYFAFSTTVFFPWLVGPCEYPHELPRGKEVRFLKKGIMLKHELASSSFYSTYWLMDTFPTNPDITRPHGLCVRESEFEGRKERNVVYIKKCRFLESSNCAGMCTNLCKVPTQEFINSSFGIPVNMVPNFDDMSCEMVFGQNPPLLQDDPAFKQPCYKLCDVKQKHDTICITNPLESMKQ